MGFEKGYKPLPRLGFRRFSSKVAMKVAMKVAVKISSVSKRRESEFPPTGLSVVSRQLVSRAWGNPQGTPKQKPQAKTLAPIETQVVTYLT